ncbi:hypothetical protein XH81_04885 [Bradyrhizobium sp. CCBAU 25360]|nr:hypothetical protein [Bradyrhizobium sp. CCBAU 25360]
MAAYHESVLVFVPSGHNTNLQKTIEAVLSKHAFGPLPLSARLFRGRGMTKSLSIQPIRTQPMPPESLVLSIAM